MKVRALIAALGVCGTVALSACSEASPSAEVSAPDAAEVAPSSPDPVIANLLAGMPDYVSASNVYAAAGAGMVREDLRGDRELVYVPNTNSDDVYVIDPKTFQVIDTYYGGPEPQHAVPSYDMRTIYIASSRVPTGGVLPIDPATGKPGELIDVQDVYNLYFTPDGTLAIVVAEAYQRLDYYDAETWEPVQSVHFPECAGINHMDFSVDGKIALVSCEFANRMVVIDVMTGQQLRQFDLDVVPDGMPQDVRLVPDGSVFLVADMHADGLYVFDGAATERIGYIPTGKGAHGIYFSRDAKYAYVSNRNEGTVTLLDLATLQEKEKWVIPGGGSPDMGGVSADGKTLWLTGRYHGEVYAINTANGELFAKIPVGAGPHGLLVWPQPGRYSLGHTGNIR